MPRHFTIWALVVAVPATFVGSAHAALNTVTYVDSSGGVPNNAGQIPDGRVEGDYRSEVTLFDIDGGDMWNGGDQFIYLHDENRVPGSFKATVRVISQTEAIDGRWGKAGIHATNGLDGLSRNAMVQVAAGNGSQVDPPPAGDHSPVPARLAGRTGDDGNGGFENPIIGTAGTEQVLDGDGNVANDVFRTAGVNRTWLSLEYRADSNEFIAGSALDIDGAPGIWSYSDPINSVAAPDDGGWYVGLAYSVHNDMTPVDPNAPYHGVTFDQFSWIPEPTSFGLLCMGLIGLASLARRRR